MRDLEEIRVDYIRDGLVEEYHCGVVAFSENALSEVYYLRSCAKPLQSTLLLDYGIDFIPEELAFCSGSHAGENCHIEVATKILEKIGLTVADLKCGVHAPLSRTMQEKMLLRGENATAIHNNCSGKHLGFLAVCKKQDWDIKSYDEVNHPLQIEVKRKIYELCEVEQNYPMTTDGCGVPIVSMSLGNLIKGYKNLNKNYSQLVKSIMDNPYIFGGENRLDTEIMQNSVGLMAKVGAGGLCVVLNSLTNEAFAVKMYDASMAARRIAVFEILKKLGWANIEYDNTIQTLTDKVVGKIITTFYD